MGTEINKLKAVQAQSQIIGEFLEWLEGNYVIAEWGIKDRLFPTRKRIEQWLALYFDIDLKKVEEERQQCLEEIRSRNGG